MADRERSMRLAENDIQTIEHVYFINTETIESSDIVDPFSQSGEIIKSLRGTSPTFKRKVSNELKKYNRSADRSTESKQLDAISEVNGYDTFGVVYPPHSLEGLAFLYQEKSSAHYAAVNAKVSNIVGLGFKLVETTKTKRAVEDVEDDEAKVARLRRRLDLARDGLYETIENLNEEDSITEILEKVWRDYESMGNGYIEVGRKADGTIGYLGHIPAQTIRVRRNRDGFVQISANKAQFFRNFGDDIPNPIGTDSNPNELIHIKKYSPTNSYYGVPDIVAAQQAVAGNEFASRYNLEFFENKAVPRHLITLKGANLGHSAQTDLLAFFETGLKGQNHRSLFIPLPPDTPGSSVEFNIEAIDTKVQEGSFDKYTKTNRNDILMAHRVPIGKVSSAEAASLATSRDADKTFKEQVCAPEQRKVEKKFNRIIKEFTDAFEFKLNEMSLTDANTQSQIDERMVKNGIWLANEVRVRDGKPTIEGGNERVNPNKPAPGSPAAQARADTTASRERDSQRTANSPDTQGEARQPKGEGRVQG